MRKYTNSEIKHICELAFAYGYHRSDESKDIFIYKDYLVHQFKMKVEEGEKIKGFDRDTLTPGWEPLMLFDDLDGDTENGKHKLIKWMGTALSAPGRLPVFQNMEFIRLNSYDLGSLYETYHTNGALVGILEGSEETELVGIISAEEIDQSKYRGKHGTDPQDGSQGWYWDRDKDFFIVKASLDIKKIEPFNCHPECIPPEILRMEEVIFVFQIYWDLIENRYDGDDPTPVWRPEIDNAEKFSLANRVASGELEPGEEGFDDYIDFMAAEYPGDEED